MKDIKQIYRDKTGWREVNPFSKYQTNVLGGETWLRAAEWSRFESRVTYYNFPNAPDTKEGEVVEAYLQDAVEKSNGLIEIYNKRPIFGIDQLGWKEIKVWVLADHQEGKEEQAPIIQRLNKIEEVLSETVKLVNELAIAVRKRFENARDKQSSSAPKAEVSAPKRISKDDIIYPLKAYLAYPGIPDYLRDVVTVKNCKKPMEQYATLKTSSLQSLLQDKEQQISDILSLQDQMSETYDKMVKDLEVKEKEIERLKEFINWLKQTEPYDWSEIKKRIDNTLNPKP